MLTGLVLAMTVVGCGAGPEPPHRVKDINPTVSGSASSDPRSFYGVGSTVYFGANEIHFVPGLWKTDGTETGTVFVRGVFPEQMTDLGGTLYFAGLDQGDEGSYALWRSDGTTAGTELIPGPAYVSELTRFNGALYVSAADGLWKSDGT